MCVESTAGIIDKEQERGGIYGSNKARNREYFRIIARFRRIVGDGDEL